MEGNEPAASAPDEGAPSGEGWPVRVRSRRERVRVPEIAALLVVLLILCVYFTVASKYFLRYDNVINILQTIAVVGIVACPATLLLIGGQLDLSVGSGVGFVGMVLAVAVTESGVAVPLAVGLAVAAGLLIGLVNGIAVTVFRVNALITTLATLAIFRGLTKLIGDGQTIPVAGFSDLGVVRPLFDVPLSVYILAAVVIVFIVVLKHTVYGRSMYAMGANASAARLSGIRTDRAVFMSFMISAACVALAGLIRLSQIRAAGGTTGSGVELSVITAVVLGGASLSGGRGGIAGTIVAVCIIGVLNNGLIQINVPQFYQEVIGGLLLLAAVSFDQLRTRLSRVE